MEVSAIGGTVSDLRREIDAADKRLAMGGLRTILFVDEIHRFNRSQQAADVSKRQVIMVTHNMLQALRVSDKTAFFLLGEMVEAGDTDDIFTSPSDPRTADYVAGRFG